MPPKMALPELRSAERDVVAESLGLDVPRTGIACNDGLSVAKRFFLPTLVVALAGWILLLVFAQQLILPGYCSAVVGSLLTHFLRGVTSTLVINPPADLALLWVAILLTTMPLLIAEYVALASDRIVASRRWSALGLFVAGYAAVWMAAGGVLMAMAIAINMITDAIGVQTIFPAIGIALLWQFTPWKQTCLQRCRSSTAALGTDDMDWLRCGFTAAAWCAGALWAMMLIPLTAEGVYVPATVIVAAVAFYERLEPA